MQTYEKKRGGQKKRRERYVRAVVNSSCSDRRQMDDRHVISARKTQPRLLTIARRPYFDIHFRFAAGFLFAARAILMKTHLPGPW